MPRPRKLRKAESELCLAPPDNRPGWVRIPCPRPPSVNNFMVRRKGVYVPTKSYRRFIDTAALEFRMRDFKMPRVEGWYEFFLYLGFRMGADADNCIKAALDACKPPDDPTKGRVAWRWGVTDDDRFCRRGHWDYHDELPSTRAVIFIRPAEPPGGYLVAMEKARRAAERKAFAL